MTPPISDDDPPTITSRPVQPDDYWPIHRLLVESVATGPPGFNWDIRRWEGRRFYDGRPGGDPNWHIDSQLWETASGQIAAVVHPDGSRFPALQVNSNFRYLEPELLDWAESNLGASDQTERAQIHLFVYEYDIYRQRLLAKRGYEKLDAGGVIRYLRFGHQPLPRPLLPEEYELRHTNPETMDDARRIADLLNAAFNRDIHNAAEYRHFAQQAPSFRQELDLVAEASDGTFAAYVGIPYDEHNRRGIFEPVCTHPNHRQKGLAKALMQEGLLRLRALGALEATVETGDQIPANRLYTSMGFTEMYKGYLWRKLL